MSHEPSPAAVPPNLRGLDLDALFAQGLHRVSLHGTGSARPVRWQPPEPEELALFFPDYEIVRLVGWGAMGAVYEAWEPACSRRVAIKLLPPELGEDVTFAERFRREARTLATLCHPGIVAVHEPGESFAGHLFFVMEYVEGETLAQRLARAPALPVGEALTLLARCCDALGFAHSCGVVHRDIKPANLLLPTDGGVKIADFGLAALSDAESALDARLTLTGAALGTLEYAAPEQLSGRGGADARSDIYALGVVAYEMLTGRVPRGVFDPPSQVNPAVDPALDSVVLTALQSDPARRYASIEALHLALERAQDVRANRAARERAVRQQLLRRARMAGAFGALALVALAAAAFGWWQYRAARVHESDARHQAARADASREDAEDLTAFLTERFIDELRDGGRTELIDQVVTQAERYFSKLPPEDLSAASRARRAQVHLQRAQVQRVRGKWEDAFAETRAAIAIADALAVEQPESAARFTAAIKARTNLTVLQMIRQQFESALAERHRLREALTFARTRFPDDAQIALLHARAWRMEGEALLNLNRLDEAHAAQTEALRLAEALDARGGASDDLRAEQACISAELGSIAERHGDKQAALTFFEHARDVYRPLVRTEQWSLERRYALCGWIARVASMQTQVGAFSAAEASAREAFPLVEQIEARSPGSTSALFQRRHLYTILASAATARGDSEAAAAARAQANAVDRQLKAAEAQKQR